MFSEFRESGYPLGTSTLPSLAYCVLTVSRLFPRGKRGMAEEARLAWV